MEEGETEKISSGVKSPTAVFSQHRNRVQQRWQQTWSRGENVQTESNENKRFPKLKERFPSDLKETGERTDCLSFSPLESWFALTLGNGPPKALWSRTLTECERDDPMLKTNVIIKQDQGGSGGYEDEHHHHRHRHPRRHKHQGNPFAFWICMYEGDFYRKDREQDERRGGGGQGIALGSTDGISSGGQAEKWGLYVELP